MHEADSFLNASEATSKDPRPHGLPIGATHQFVGGESQLHRHVLQAPAFDPVLVARQSQLADDAEDSHPYLTGQGGGQAGTGVGSRVGDWAPNTQSCPRRQLGIGAALGGKGPRGLLPTPSTTPCLIQGIPLGSLATQEPSRSLEHTRF